MVHKSKLRANVRLLKNNSKVGLFTSDGWKIGLLYQFFLKKKYIHDQNHMNGIEEKVLYIKSTA